MRKRRFCVKLCVERTRDLGHYLRVVLGYTRKKKLEDNLDEDFLDPYHVAVMTENLEHLDILWKFLRHGKSDLYCYAAERGKCKIVQVIIDRMKDKNPQVKKNNFFFISYFYQNFFLQIFDGLTLLHCVAGNGHADVVKLMMDRIPDKNPKTFDGRCPIHFAASKGHFQTVQLIMEEIQDKNPKTDRGITPLHLASQNGHLETVICIMNKINEDKRSPKDESGRTPLHYACENGHVDVVKYILEQIDDKNPRDKRGRTPLWYAAKFCHVDVLKCIKM